jgi:L-arabinose isomerase
MIDPKRYEVWFATGSQDLYGDKTLQQVEMDTRRIVEGLGASTRIPVPLRFKPVLTTPAAIRTLCQEANAAPTCIGLILWMHTFSPAKMWIAGLTELRKPFLHLHTQFNRDIPWATIDMDFMNLNQSAHGDREFGFIGSRLRIGRKVVVGHWQDPEVQDRAGAWMRAALAWHDTRNLRVARFGDNMREVAVTEGDKVEAQIRFGYSVNGYGVGDLAARVSTVTEAEVDGLVKQYEGAYRLAEPLRSGAGRESLVRAARIECGMRAFLEEGGFGAFTTTFQDLHGLEQLPGIAVQRLMADGYGFGAEGDWKTSALVRAVKVMGAGLDGGTSFMEDYTYHLDPAGPKVLGAHMLEICPSIGKGKAAAEIHELSIGGKAPPVRLTFAVPPGPALNATIVDMGNRFRMLVNEVDVVSPDAPMPRLPVAQVLWVPRPSLAVSAAAWILAGGAHHTAFTKAVTTEHLEDYAEMAGIECVVIDAKTEIRDLKKELRWNEAYHHLAGAF